MAKISDCLGPSACQNISLLGSLSWPLMRQYCLGRWSRERLYLGKYIKIFLNAESTQSVILKWLRTRIYENVLEYFRILRENAKFSRDHFGLLLVPRGQTSPPQSSSSILNPDRQPCNFGFGDLLLFLIKDCYYKQKLWKSKFSYHNFCWKIKYVAKTHK